jgi:hypothetical protein
MQEVVRKQIMPDTHLTYVKTDKFKTCCLSVNLITKLDRDDAAKNALLPRVLLRGTTAYPDMQSLNNQLDELYGARVVPMVRKKGEMHCIAFWPISSTTPCAEVARIFSVKSTSLVVELLLEPNTHGGLCCPNTSTEKKRTERLYTRRHQR